MVLWVTYYCLWCFSSHHGYPALGKHAHLPRWKLGPVRSQKQAQRPIYIYIDVCVCVTYITAINDCKMLGPEYLGPSNTKYALKLVVFVGPPCFRAIAISSSLNIADSEPKGEGCFVVIFWFPLARRFGAKWVKSLGCKDFKFCRLCFNFYMFYLFA